MRTINLKRTNLPVADGIKRDNAFFHYKNKCKAKISRIELEQHCDYKTYACELREEERITLEKQRRSAFISQMLKQNDKENLKSL